MKNKLYLLSRGNKTVGVIFNEDKNVASRLDFTSEVETTKNQYIITAVDSITKCLEQLDVKEFTNVCQIYVPSEVLKAIQDETYKFWLMTGVTSKGEAVEGLEVWNKFADIWALKNRCFVFRNIATCYIKDEIKAIPQALAKVSHEYQANDKFARYCITEMNKISPKEKATANNLPEVC